MTIPGVDVTTAATLIAAIGDVSRFPSPRHLTGYLGLDPKLRQSGVARPRQGRISKEGSAAARHALVEAAWSTAKAPGPLRAFAERTAARRGRHIAAVAVARKLAVLAWHLLSRGEDYAYQRPSVVRRKPARAQDGCPAGEAPGRGRAAVGQPRPGRPRARARRPGRARLPPTRRRLAAHPTQGRCGCDTGARIFSAVNAASSAAGDSPTSCALARRHPHLPKSSNGGTDRPQDLTFIRTSRVRLSPPQIDPPATQLSPADGEGLLRRP
jgi:Transposase IS116/IS110/IS902 family